jgi:N-acetylglutamate synthase-like GNAT family acetyltransferase
MIKNVVRYIENETDVERVRTFFDSMDDDFYPPISQRDGKLERYLGEPSKQGKIALFEREGDVVGALAYKLENREAIVEIMGVAKNYRGTPILYRLLEHAIKSELKDDGIERVKAETWSTHGKQRRVFETLGFKLDEEVENDIIQGRTTVRYGADFSEICEFFDLS